MGGRGGSSGVAAKSAEEISLDKRFKRYDYNGYTIYHSGGGFAVYDFKNPPMPVDAGGKNKSHVIFYKKRLRDAKAQIDATKLAKQREKQRKNKLQAKK